MRSILILAISLLEPYFANGQCNDRECCGVSSKEIFPDKLRTNRIVGGWEAVPNSLPWQVRIEALQPNDPDNCQLCGGALISNPLIENGTNLVITAAHCVEYSDRWLPPDRITVVVGSHYFQGTPETTAKTLKAQKLIPNKLFDSVHLENDIALLRLNEIVPYTNETRPICLPTKHEKVPIGMTCVASGWGVADINNIETASALRITPAKILEPTECGFSYNTSRHFCAGGAGHICQGDSGGPLSCYMDGKYVLYGISSYGDRECTNSMFVNVPAYMEWIERKTRQIQPKQRRPAELIHPDISLKNRFSPLSTMRDWIRNRKERLKAIVAPVPLQRPVKSLTTQLPATGQSPADVVESTITVFGRAETGPSFSSGDVPSQVGKPRVHMVARRVVRDAQFIGHQVIDVYTTRIRWSEPTNWNDCEQEKVVPNNRCNTNARAYEIRCWLTSQGQQRPRILVNRRLSAEFSGYGEKFQFPTGWELTFHCAVRAINVKNMASSWKPAKPLLIHRIPIYLPGLEGIDVRPLNASEVLQVLKRLNRISPEFHSSHLHS